MGEVETPAAAATFVVGRRQSRTSRFAQLSTAASARGSWTAGVCGAAGSGCAGGAASVGGAGSAGAASGVGATAVSGGVSVFVSDAGMVSGPDATAAGAGAAGVHAFVAIAQPAVIATTATTP